MIKVEKSWTKAESTSVNERIIPSELLGEETAEIYEMSLVPGGRWLVVTHTSGEVVLWDLDHASIAEASIRVGRVPTQSSKGSLHRVMPLAYDFSNIPQSFRVSVAAKTRVLRSVRCRQDVVIVC